MVACLSPVGADTAYPIAMHPIAPRSIAPRHWAQLNALWQSSTGYVLVNRDGFIADLSTITHMKSSMSTLGRMTVLRLMQNGDR